MNWMKDLYKHTSVWFSWGAQKGLAMSASDELNHVERWMRTNSSAPFSGSHSRSALFNIFRAAGSHWERRGRENHCCYGDEGRCDKRRGLIRQWPWAECWCVLTTRRSPNQHSTRDAYLRLFTLIMSGSPRWPLHRLNAASICTFTHWMQGDMTACDKVKVKTTSTVRWCCLQCYV